MHNTFHLPSTVDRTTVFLGCVLAGLLLTGCGEKAPHLETTTVTSPAGRPGVCAHCNERIDNVTKEHLIAVRGNQYIVCDDTCAAALKEWLAKQ